MKKKLSHGFVFYKAYEEPEENAIGHYVCHVSDGKSILVGYRICVKELPFCCGILEMGGFTLIKQITSEGVKNEMIEAIGEVLNSVINMCRDVNNTQRLLMFTLINNITCDYFKEAALKTKMFKCVKTFRNLNTGNENYLYITK